MIRIILVNLLLLMLPMLIYFGYVYLRKQEPNGEILSNAPIFWLLAGGAGLMLIALVVLGQWESGDPEGRYVPPQFKDGIVVPGHIERHN